MQHLRTRRSKGACSLVEKASLRLQTLTQGNFMGSIPIMLRFCSFSPMLPRKQWHVQVSWVPEAWSVPRSAIAHLQAWSIVNRGCGRYDCFFHFRKRVNLDKLRHLLLLSNIVYVGLVETCDHIDPTECWQQVCQSPGAMHGFKESKAYTFIDYYYTFGQMPDSWDLDMYQP